MILDYFLLHFVNKDKRFYMFYDIITNQISNMASNNTIPLLHDRTFNTSKIGTITITDNIATLWQEIEPFWISKYSLRQTLRQYNLEAALDNFLNTNSNIRNDYIDAQKLKSDNPLLVDAMNDISLQTGINLEQIKTILYNCKDE